MTEEKAKRLAVSCTVTAVLLLFILVCVLVYQVAALGGAKNRQKKLEAEKQKLIAEIENINQEIENRSTDWSIEIEARKQGLIDADDERFK